jgi:hypothetical protein
MKGSYKSSLMVKWGFVWAWPVGVLGFYIVAFSGTSIDFKVITAIFLLGSIKDGFIPQWKRLRTNVYEIKYSVPDKRLEFIGFFGGHVLSETDMADVMYSIEDGFLIFITTRGDEIKLKAKYWRDTRDLYSTYYWWPHHLVSFYIALIRILSGTADVHTKFLSIKVPDWRAMKNAKDPRVVNLYQELEEVLNSNSGDSAVAEEIK